MGEDRLKKLARRLDAELDSAGDISASDRALLDELRRDISRVTGGAGETAGLRERAGRAMRRFEKEHPTITLVLKQVLDTLERIGI